MTHDNVPSKLVPPIDVSKLKNEVGVKKIIKDLLDFYGWFSWTPGAGSVGATAGQHDRFALKHGVFLSIEAKWAKGKPTALQSAFAGHVMANDCFAFCVSEKNIDHLAWWLASFDIATAHQSHGLEVPQEHGARMLNAVAAMVEPF